MCVLLGILREFPVDPYYEPLAWFMITATYSECIIINYIYYYSSRTGDSFAGGLISVDYSIRKLQHVIEKRAIKSYKNSQNLLHRDVSACILSYKNSIAISLLWV